MTNGKQKEEILSFAVFPSITSQCLSKYNLVKVGSSLFDKPKEITIGLDALTKLSFVLICNFCPYHLPQAMIYLGISTVTEYSLKQNHKILFSSLGDGLSDFL